MRPNSRALKKWRKSSPMKSRSFAEKRDRLNKKLREEIKDAKHRHTKEDL